MDETGPERIDSYNVRYNMVTNHVAIYETDENPTSQPLSTPKESNESMDLDEILDELGNFGKFQSISFLLISFPIIFSAIFALSYIFTAGDLNYRCRIHECDGEETSFEPSWLKNAVPFEEQGSTTVPSRCLMFPYSKNASLFFEENASVINTSVLSYNDSVCTSDFFNRNEIVRCKDWIYEGEGSTILREWDITCEENRWKLTLVGTINNIGQFIGMPIAGLISDRIGRKKTLVLAVLLAGTMGIARSLAWSYMSFLVFEFLDPVCGSGLYTAGFVLGMELVGPRGRVFAGTIISVFYTIGEVILGCVSMWLQKWRLILRSLYFPALLCLAHYWLASESVRWLLTKGKTKEATDIVQRAAKTNGVVLSQQVLNKLRSPTVNKESTETQEQNENAKKSNLLQIFKSKILLRRLINSAFCWLTITFVFFGLSLNSVSVGGNKYSNFILVALVEVPAYIAFYFSMDWLGRRNTLCISLIISGVSCISFAFLPADMDMIKLLLFLMGKFGITISFAVVFVFTAELFPTEFRHSMLGLCSMLGRIGSIIAPQTPLLERYYESLPLLLFGCMSMFSGILAFTFPETLNLKLPDTIEEAENIGRKREK